MDSMNAYAFCFDNRTRFAFVPNKHMGTIPDLTASGEVGSEKVNRRNEARAWLVFCGFRIVMLFPSWVWVVMRC